MQCGTACIMHATYQVIVIAYLIATVFALKIALIKIRVDHAPVRCAWAYPSKSVHLHEFTGLTSCKFCPSNAHQ